MQMAITEKYSTVKIQKIKKHICKLKIHECPTPYEFRETDRDKE